MNKCAILTMDCLDDFEVYDYLIDSPLADLGWQVELVSWRKPDVDWTNYSAVIIRSPWDYQDDAPAFINVLETIDASSAHLENSLAIVRWNIDKQYLQDLQKQDVEIVPTIWQDRLIQQRLSESDILNYFSQLKQKQIVLKPRISANSDNTFWLTESNIHQRLDEINDAFSTRDFMVQPFMESVIAEGEYSLFYFNGDYSHAILKTPKKDDFRVQEEHGGQLKAVIPEKNLLEYGQKTMDAITRLHQTPLYARIDFVRYDDGFALMEAELIEPSLYFNMDEGSPKRFAKAFVDRIQHITL
ncbi:ATP-grasp domain-containing protein [Thalassotalea piscium]